MNKAAKLAIGASTATLGTTAVLSIFLVEEVMYHKPLIFPKVSKIMTKKFVKDNGGEEEHKVQSKVEENRDWFNSVKPVEYDMINSEGLKLHGYLFPADEKSDVYVVCCHGYTSSGYGDYSLKAKFWHDCGYNVFLVDHRCHGKSEGKWIGFGYHERKDTLEWLEFLKKEFGDDIRFVLHGISMGSATVMMMSGSEELPSNVKCTVADCGYTSCRDELKYGLNEVAHLPDFPFLYTGNIVNKIVNGYSFNDPNPLESVKYAKVPILFIHGGNDLFVPTRMGKELYEACSNEKKDLLIIDGAGHTESHWVDPIKYEEKATSFVKEILG